jgi:SAM-dependent methyltransferase
VAVSGDESAVELRQDQPHTARMYDYYLGGKTYYEADRLAVERVKQVFPTVETCARANRAFMHRAVEYLAGQGVRQFLDIGTGIPTEPNLHQVAQRVAPESRVVYVDNDPIVLTYARALMVGTPEGVTEYLHADLTRPQEILGAAEVTRTLDFARPVALSLIAVVHFIPDGHPDPYAIVRTLLDALAPGSYLVMSHLTPDFDPETVNRLVGVYRSSGLPGQARDATEFGRFFAGLELVDPGITLVHRWRPPIQPPRWMDPAVSFYGAVARKP